MGMFLFHFCYVVIPLKLVYVLACSGLGRLSHSCLSGPEQQGRCEEGDCQEAAVAGGSQSRCSCISQLCHWAFSTPAGCRQLLSPWQLPSSGLSCPSPRAEIITRRLKVVRKPTQSTACRYRFTVLLTSKYSSLEKREVGDLLAGQSGCREQPISAQGCLERVLQAGPRPLSLARPMSHTRLAP